MGDRLAGRVHPEDAARLLGAVVEGRGRRAPRRPCTPTSVPGGRPVTNLDRPLLVRRAGAEGGGEAVAPARRWPRRATRRATPATTRRSPPASPSRVDRRRRPTCAARTTASAWSAGARTRPHGSVTRRTASAWSAPGASTTNPVPLRTAISASATPDARRRCRARPASRPSVDQRPDQVGDAGGARRGRAPGPAAIVRPRSHAHRDPASDRASAPEGEQRCRRRPRRTPGRRLVEPVDHADQSRRPAWGRCRAPGSRCRG